MSSNWAVEFAGAGSCSGELIRAEYEHTAAGWHVVYLIGEDVVATSAAPRHPSLRMLGPDAAGEKRVIKTAFAVIDSLEEGVNARARRDVQPAKPRRRKAPARPRAQA